MKRSERQGSRKSFPLFIIIFVIVFMAGAVIPPLLTAYKLTGEKTISQLRTLTMINNMKNPVFIVVLLLIAAAVSLIITSLPAWSPWGKNKEE